jgi:hypothetical protein
VRAAHFLPDRWAILFLYRLQLGRWPNLAAPQLFTEKLQWMKLHDRNPLYRIWVDKLAVRRWIAEHIGQRLLIPALAFFDCPVEMAEQIHNIPVQPMMIKCSHGSHCGIHIRDQIAVDMDAIMWRVMRWTWRDWYWYGREWPYKGLKPKILCEKWIGAEDGTPPVDYKLMCFNGRARVIQIHQKKRYGHQIDFYDTGGYKLPFGLHGYANCGPAHAEIPQLARMIEIAERIAAGTRYLRVDLYVVGGQVFFGEITMYDSSGFGRYTNGGDRILGELLQGG